MDAVAGVLRNLQWKMSFLGIVLGQHKGFMDQNINMLRVVDHKLTGLSVTKINKGQPIPVKASYRTIDAMNCREDVIVTPFSS